MSGSCNTASSECHRTTTAHLCFTAAGPPGIVQLREFLPLAKTIAVGWVAYSFCAEVTHAQRSGASPVQPVF
eukprot:1711073-Amphidinium_carterae.1